MERVPQETEVRTFIEKRAGEELTNLPRRKSVRIAQAIDGLAQDPISGSHLLRITDDGTSLMVKRVGDYVMMYCVDANSDTVIVLVVRKEKDAFDEKP